MNTEVTGSTLRRWFVYDTSNGDSTVTQLVGLFPVEEEGHAVELALSKERKDAVAPLVPLLSDYATYVGPLVQTAVFSGLEAFKSARPESTVEELLNVQMQIVQHVMFSALMGVLSGLTALEVITKAELAE